MIPRPAPAPRPFAGPVSALLFACALASACALPDTALQPAPAAPAAEGMGSAMMGGAGPLLVIGWSDGAVETEAALRAAVGAALREQPEAAFELVSVSPGVAAGAEPSLARRVEAVLRTLADMGVAPGRVALTVLRAGDGSTGDLRLYLR